MGRLRNWWRTRSVSALAIFLAVLPAFAVEAPAGTEINLRLTTRVASNAAKVKDPVDAIVLQPVVVKSQVVIPAGTAAHGVVLEVKASTGPDDRALLNIVFTQVDLAGGAKKLVSTVSEVDNARESVNTNGQIQGITAAESISARLDAGISKVAGRYAGLAGILERAKSVVLEEPDANIVYEPGVELTIKLDEPLEAPAAAGNGFPKLQPVAAAQVAGLVTRQPFQTRAQSPPKESDITNLMFVGSQEQLVKAFDAAGWASAASNNSVAKFQTFKAIAESRGYKEAPVSVLRLEDRPPDLVFEKQNNTFSQRHHLRIWRRPDTFRGQPVWVCAATHDVGIDASVENRTFIHKIDSNIDRERDKVASDLLLTGQVKSHVLVDRPKVPKESANATGDKLITDGKMAVIVF